MSSQDTGSQDSERLGRLEALVRGAKHRALEIDEIPDRIGAYKILGQLGRGGMGSVLLAEHEELGRRVALKLIRPEFRFVGEARERFLREAKAASRLDHPGICPVYELGEHDGAPFLAMRYVEGETLSDRIAAAERDGMDCIEIDAMGDPMLVAAMFEKVARALHAAHQQGLVHRDIKPSNIIVTNESEPILLDFGVALDERDRDQGLTMSGQMIGTPLYLPPEQVERPGYYRDKRGDIYSLGVTLYECLTLTRPFQGVSQHQLFETILRSTPVSARHVNPNIPRDLSVVTHTAMERDPDRRYRSADHFAADLARVLRKQPIQARPASPWLRTRRWAQRNPFAAMFVGLLLVALPTFAVMALVYAATLGDLDRSSLSVRLDKTTERHMAEVPARPEYVPAFEAWLAEQAEPLTHALPELLAKRDAYRSKALPYTPAQRERDAAKHAPKLARAEAVAERDKLRALLQTIPDKPPPDATPKVANSIRLRRQAIPLMIDALEKRIAELDRDPGGLRSYEFAKDRDRLLHDGLEALVRGIEELSRNEVPWVRESLAWANSVEHASFFAHGRGRLWENAIAAVAASAKYANTELPPQLGLVPLGPDPRSGLQEFAHLRSGSIPKRGADGALAVDDDTCIVFVLVPPGSFAMGSQSEDPSAPCHYAAPESDEVPVHEIRLDAFFLSKFELTQRQWRKLDHDSRPSTYRAGTWHGQMITPRNPVESVSWTAATRVLRRHSLQLPTEAQWEYACRAGTTTPWATGRELSSLPKYENLGDRSAALLNPTWAHERWLDGHVVHAPVGSLLPNRWGFHDMHGNVSEWCRDWSLPYQRSVAAGDGLRQGTLSDTRAVRGGAFDHSAAVSRAARRNAWGESYARGNLGLRPSRPIER